MVTKLEPDLQNQSVCLFSTYAAQTLGATGVPTLRSDKPQEELECFPGSLMWTVVLVKAQQARFYVDTPMVTLLIASTS